MGLKPRRTKSLLSFQHSSNKDSPWDDEDSDSDDESKKNSGSSGPIFTLSGDIEVRPVRRTDAAAAHKILQDPTIAGCFLDTTFEQPFSLWHAHKLVDDALDKEKNWRRQNLGNSGEPPTEDDVYEQAVKALAGFNLEEKLRQNEQQPSRDPGIRSLRKKDKRPLIPIQYAITHRDTFIGLVEVMMQEPLTPDGDGDKYDPEDLADPAILHEAELCYWISEEYRNRGITTSVVREFLSWAWRNFAQLERIGAGVYSTWNPASAKVMEKCGATFEGVWKGGVRKDGRFGRLDQYCLFRPGGKVEQLLKQGKFDS